MNILNFGGGEIWKGIQEELVYQGHTFLSIPKKNCDLRYQDQVDMVVDGIRQDFTTFDWVIFTAGISKVTSLNGCDPYALKQEMDTNYWGMVNVAKYCSAIGIKNYIALISVAGMYGKPNHAGYSASKAALRSLIQSMAMEGLNAYGISPGRVDTAMRHRDYPNERKETRLEVSEIAGLVSEIMDGEYEPGDNLIIRRIGTETQPIQIDRGEPWKTQLKVGQPPTV